MQLVKSDHAHSAQNEQAIAHHEGALEMLDLLDDTKNTEAKKIATDIAKGQSAEITFMKKLLAKAK